MGLLQVGDSQTISVAVSDVQITGIDSDDVYCLVASGITTVTDGAYLQTRVVKDVSGTDTTQSTNAYKNGAKNITSNTGFGNYVNGGTPRTEMYFCGAQPVGASFGETAGIVAYLYNFNSSSKYSSIMVTDYQLQSTPTAVGGQAGSTIYAVAEAHNGISISGYSTNIDGGTFTLFKVV